MNYSSLSMRKLTLNLRNEYKMKDSWKISWIRVYDGVSKTIGGCFDVPPGTTFNNALKLAKKNFNISSNESRTIFDFHRIN